MVFFFSNFFPFNFRLTFHVFFFFLISFLCRDWTTTPPWSFLVEDATVSSLEVTIFNEKAAMEKMLSGTGGSMMGTCHISLPHDVLSRKDPKEPAQKWMHLSRPKDNVTKQKKKIKSEKMPMVLVETWFEVDGGSGRKKGKPAVGWAPTKGTERPMPFFPTPKALETPGTLWIQPLEAYDLRNMETAGFTQDPFVRVTLLCGNDKKPAGSVDSEIAYDKGTKASWKTSKPLSIAYDASMGKNAMNAGSTPYLKVEVWDKNKLMSNRLVGRVELPILPLLQKPEMIYARTMTMMDEEQVGVRGKLDCKLQFLPTMTDDATVNNVPFASHAPYAAEAQGGDLTLSVVKARDLVKTQMFGVADPFVRVRLSRGGFAAKEFEREAEAQADDVDEGEEKTEEEKEAPFFQPPREAISLSSATHGKSGGGASSYTTRSVEDGGTDPVWDEPPFSLTTWDAVFDMLHVEIVNEDTNKVIGNFELPLVEVLAMKDGEDNSSSGDASSVAVEIEHAPDPGEGGDDDIEHSEEKTDTTVTAASAPSPIDIAEGWYPVFKCDQDKAEKQGEIRLQMRFEDKEVLDKAADQVVHYGPVRYLGGSGYIHVHVVGARNMRMKDKDVFVNLRLWPDDAPGPSHPAEHGWNQKTPVDERSGKNEDPMFNKSYVVPLLWKPGDERPPTMTFELKQETTMGSGTIGSCVLDLAPFVLFPNQPAIMYLPLGRDGRDGEILAHVQFVHVEEGSTRRDAMKKPVPAFPRHVMQTITGCTHRGDMDLTISKARNLAVVQWQIMGKQDPFVRVKVYGGSLGAKGVMTETRHKKNGGTNAVWMEQLQVAFDDTVLPPGTSSTPLMEFTVLDKNDTYAATKIGKVLVPMFPFQMNDGHTGENWFPLRTGTGKSTKLAGELHVASQWLHNGMLAGAGGPKLSGDRPLYVNVVGARGLPQAKILEKQDPFVTIEILGQDVRASTAAAIDQAQAPSWNAYFPLPMSDSEFSGESPTIVVTVKDKGGNAFIAKCELQLPDDVLSPPYKSIELKHFVLTDKKGNPTTGTIWLKFAREPFPGMEGRDDGLSRGEGQTTLLKDLGEDEDDDGLADGRLHVELISVDDVPQLEGVDLRKRGCKLRLQLNPPGKLRESRVCPAADKVNENEMNTCSFNYALGLSKGQGGGSTFNSLVLPHTINDDGRGAVETGESLLTVRLVEPAHGLFGRDKVLASGSVRQSVLQRLIVKPTVAASESIRVKVPLKSGLHAMNNTTAIIKLQYIPAMSGRLRINVRQARNLKNVARIGVQDPICTLILGKYGTVRTDEAKDGGNRPKWKNQQRFISYTNAKQTKPEELKVILKNNGLLGKTIGVCTIPMQSLVATAGNESTVWYSLLTEGKGQPAGEIEISLLFTKDLGEEGIQHATVEEEEDVEQEVAAAAKGEVYKPPPRVVEREKKKKAEKEKALDAGARLSLLKKLFYKIDTNGDKEVDQNELAEMLESINADYEILEVYLREKCGLDVNIGGNTEATTTTVADQKTELTASVILKAIDADGDHKITWEEWTRFLGDGHQHYDANADAAAKAKQEVVKPSKTQQNFIDLNKIDNAKVTKNDNTNNRNRELEEQQKKRNALLAAQLKAQQLEEDKRKKAHARKLKELEDQKLQMADERDRLLELQRDKDMRDKLNADKIQELEARNKAAMEAMERDRLRREEENKKKQKEKKKRKKQQKALEERRVPRPPDNMISHWRPYHVSEWLDQCLDLGQYSEMFEQSSVDGLLLISLTDKDMRTTLGIRRRLHRAKIGVHVKRLAELSGLEAAAWSSTTSKKNRSKKNTGGNTTVDWGDNGGASNPAAPELLRMQMEKLTKRRRKAMKKEDAEDQTHAGYWAFEYDNPRNADVVTQADAWDFDDDWADQFGDDAASFEHGNEMDDEYDRPADEEEFRNVMKEVWARDAQKAQQAGMSNDALNAFGASGGANAAYDAVDDPFTVVTKFAGENNMSFYQALQTPEIKRLRLRLKTGHSVYSAAADAVKCRQLPPEYWFKSQAPWWMTLKQSGGVSGEELHSKLVKARKIPYHATTEEVLTCVRQAVLEYGRYLHHQKKQELDPESLQMDLEEKHKRIEAMRARQGLTSHMQPLSVEEDRLLSDAYQAMSRMQNNTTITSGKSGSWTGTHDKLNRLKFQGATKVLLKLNMNWQQFDAVFRAISTNADGAIQEDEFVAAFRSSAELADLLKNAHQEDRIGGESRQGGQRRRLLKQKGYHGLGAKAGDSEAQQIHDALDAILSTLEDTRINLREAFESFDRSANGSISVAEFASLIKTLGGLGLSKRQIYRLASSMDADFDRTVQYVLLLLYLYFFLLLLFSATTTGYLFFRLCSNLLFLWC